MTIEDISQERDPSRLLALHTSDNPVEVMRAAANRIYDLCYKEARK